MRCPLGDTNSVTSACSAACVSSCAEPGDVLMDLAKLLVLSEQRTNMAADALGRRRSGLPMVDCRQALVSIDAERVSRSGKQSSKLPSLVRRQSYEPVATVGVHGDLDRRRPCGLIWIVWQVLRSLNVQAVWCAEAARPRNGNRGCLTGMVERLTGRVGRMIPNAPVRAVIGYGHGVHRLSFLWSDLALRPCDGREAQAAPPS